MAGTETKPVPEAPNTPIHGTCVVAHGRGILIIGASGSGKSGLALSLMALGARLVADDRVILTAKGDQVLASAPKTIQGLIEARGIGILNADAYGPAIVHLVVDLDHTEPRRLPETRQTMLLGHAIPLLHQVDSPYFAAALMQYILAGRRGIE